MLDNRRSNTLHLLAGSSTTTALDAARTLLANGANASAKGDEGLTPLHVACAYDCLAMAQLLMHYGADPQAEDDHGRTPFSMATGNTQRFLQRILAKDTREQRGIIRRLFACHAMALSVNGGFMRSIRRKVRRSLSAIGYRRPRLEALPVTEMETSTRAVVLPVTPTGKATTSNNRKQSASKHKQSASQAAHPGYPSADIMPKPSCSRAPVSSTVPRRAATKIKTTHRSKTPDIPSSTPAPKVRTRSSSGPETTSNRKPATNGHGKSTQAPHRQAGKQAGKTPLADVRNSAQNRASSAVQPRTATAATTPKAPKPRCQPSAPPIDEMPADELSRWLSEKDSSQDTQGTDVYLTADESFDMAELQRRIEQMKMGDPTSSPHVDDGQLRKIRRLNDAQLRAELKKVGIVAGPMCARTRGMYEKKLLTMRRDVADTKGVRYSRQLELAMMGMLSSEAGKILDDKIREEFQLAGVTAFCYLLLDPRKITEDVESLDLKKFVPAIFYVGKGTKARPLAHLIEAKKERDAKSPKVASNVKLKRIDSIWGAGNGVLCLQINHSVSDDEAFVREAALIEAIRLENLTNVKGGEWRGTSKTWTLSMKAEFGTYQLERALGVLKMEGLRPIKPEALPDSSFPFAQKKNA
ncbi:LEM domain protein [Ancylostoma caninum]|uniref:LEM domain protein n=1 Tax=Ancylostoma caninum TaxID=29170 RepID=A0A368GL10_ANCCA|nr:LEM domain protein [Ancylostoma caninum]